MFFGEASGTGTRVGFFLNNGNGGSWTLQVLPGAANGGRPYVGDFGGDGDLDIASLRDDILPVEIWYNQSN